MNITSIALEDEIRSALGKDPRFPEGSEGFTVMAAHVPGALVAAVGDKLDKPFSLEGFLGTECEFLRTLADPDTGLPAELDGIEATLVTNLYNMMADQFDGIRTDIPGFLEGIGMTELETFENANPAFDDEMLEAIKAGTLTFRKLVTSQPGVFIPTS